MRENGFFTAKPSLEEYLELIPELDESEAREQIERLPEEYFILFPDYRLGDFARDLSSLDESAPYRFELDEVGEGRLEVRIIAFETESFFALVAGAISAGGMDIQSGDIFTYGEQEQGPAGRARRGGLQGRSRPWPRDAHRGGHRGARRDARRGAQRDAGSGAGGFRASSGRGGTVDRMGRKKLVDVFYGRWEAEGASPPGEGNAAGEGSAPGEGNAAGRRRELERVVGRTLSALYSESEEADGASRKAVDRAKEMVAEELAGRLFAHRKRRNENEEAPPFYPVELEVGESSDTTTELIVRSQDTPFFLYAFGTVLALHEISIEHVEIQTTEFGIEDRFFVRSTGRSSLEDPNRINSIKLSILFTKQFTHYLWNAPDPYRALLRFETLIREIRMSPGGESVHSLIADPNVLRRLSRLLGASDFLWEDFIRLQYENILPLLSGDSVVRDIDISPEGLRRELEEKLEEAEGFEEKKQALNDFKDRFTYLVDLEHIVDPNADFFFLSTQLSTLADLVVRSAFDLAWRHLISVYGVPRTVANLPTVYAVAGLGKFGGKALGYASDIELLVLYRDAGETDGEKRISNGEFFTHLVRTASSIIESKQEGIYRVDLRLRPHGAGGPLAVSLPRFVSYYRHEAASLEKLSLVRLRTVAGDGEFCSRIERLRDSVIYEGKPIDVEELIRLRRVQVEKYASKDRPNVKYGPGGLLDLEYCVQILQVMEGRSERDMRTPYMHEIFPRLSEKGLLDAEIVSMLEGSYFFLRRLINALRMLRGNALDLYLPERSSSEFLHLARRMGYREEDGVPAEEQLFIDYRRHSAVVRNFVEKRLGSRAVAAAGPGTIADLLLSARSDQKGDQKSDQPAEKGEEKTKKGESASSLQLFENAGFGNSSRAMFNFFSLFGRWDYSPRFIELALFAWDYLRCSPDPDMALNNWERFAASHPEPEGHFGEIYRQPKRLEILLRIFAASQFLADVLMRNPGFFSDVTDPGKIGIPMRYTDFYDELTGIRRGCGEHEEEWKRELRMFRHRHILRIGSRDICYGVPLEEVLVELSGLADAVLQAELDYRIDDTAGNVDPEKLCIFAFGKLGGKELNYSSDIDLVVVCDFSSAEQVDRKHMHRLVRRLRADIADVTEEGRVYRVDFRLRPYGSSGELFFSPTQMKDYYRRSAALWEFQALLKARTVAGNREMGARLLEDILGEVLPRLASEMGPQRIVEAVVEARAIKREDAELDVKEGRGGLRDIEFLVQALQLIHADDDLICGNTLESAARLKRRGVIPPSIADELSRAYRFLRRVEHFLQLLEDRQEHSLPHDRRALEALAGRMRWGPECSGDFSERLERTRERVHGLFYTLLKEYGRTLRTPD